MSWDALIDDVTRFRNLLNTLGLRVPDDSPLTEELARVGAFLDERSSMSEDAWVQRWAPQLNEMFPEIVGVARLAESAVSMPQTTMNELRKRLKLIVNGSVKQNFAPQAAKDYLYELEIATVMQRAGFIITLREPDVQVSGHGLSQPLGIACKYPSSPSQLHEHISKGYAQIAGQGLRGFVSIGMDLIAFGWRPKLLDFRQGERHPLEVVQECLDAHVLSLVAERTSGYPSEKPLDGLLLTLRAWGVFGKPAGIQAVTGMTIQCDHDNPIIGDFGVIVSELSKLSNPAAPVSPDEKTDEHEANSAG